MHACAACGWEAVTCDAVAVYVSYVRFCMGWGLCLSFLLALWCCCRDAEMVCMCIWTCCMQARAPATCCLHAVMDKHGNEGWHALQVKLIHINNTGPDLLPLKTSRITLDWTYRGLNKTEKLAIWEDGECLDSLKRPMDENDTSTHPDTVHHYCEEFWFKTNVDIVLNMTAVIPVIDNLFEDYFPSLPGEPQAIPAHIKGHVGLTKMIPQSGGMSSRDKQSTRGQPAIHQTGGFSHRNR